MGNLFVLCPTTQQLVSIGVLTDQTTYKSLAKLHPQTRCPICGECHTWSEAALQLSEAQPANDNAMAA